MSQKKTKKVKESTSYDIHSLLDFMIVDCACLNKSSAQRFTIPYKNVLQVGQDDKYLNSQLIVEIHVKWDAKIENQKVPVEAPDKSRH